MMMIGRGLALIMAVNYQKSISGGTSATPEAVRISAAGFGWLGNVRPEPGAAAFCGVVVLTMLASESFDPRLLWDAGGHNGPGELAGAKAVSA